MKKILLALFFVILAVSIQAQCPNPSISIDDFSGSECSMSLSNSDPLNTVLQTECTGNSGAISGAADIWIQKNVAAGGGSAADIGYYGFGTFELSPSSLNISTFSITYDGADGNTDPNSPTLTGPVLGNFTNRTIQLLADLDGISAGKSVTFTASVWDASANRSDAILTISGSRSGTTAEILNLGLLIGTADLTDIRAIQFKMTTTQNGFDLSMNQLSAVCNGFVLPLKLTGFSGNYANGLTDLNWSTSPEINAEHFEIESSTDGANFSKVGTMAAKANIGSALNYSFHYDALLSTTIWFRLKVFDIDGRYIYSSIIKIIPSSQAPDSFNVFPTVFSNSFTLALQSENTKPALLRITGVNGSIQYSKPLNLNKGNNTIAIDGLDKLAKAVYIVQIIFDDKTVYKKIIRQ